MNNISDPLSDFPDGTLSKTADDTARAFEAAGERIADALEKAARSGEFSFNSMAESITRDLARIAINDLISGPLQSVIGGIGARLIGGGRNSPTINMNLNGVTDAQSFQRSQGQISATLARAVIDGQRYI